MSDKSWTRACKLTEKAFARKMDSYGLGGLTLDDCPDTCEIDNIRHYCHELCKDHLTDEEILATLSEAIDEDFGDDIESFGSSVLLGM